jgi:hypothetical protein
LSRYDFTRRCTVYREKFNADIYNVGLIVRTLLGRLTEDQLKQYLAVVSDEVSTVTDEKEFRYNLHLMPPAFWQQLSEASRMRVENRVVRSINEGQFVNRKIQRGALATWAREHFPYFTLEYQVGTAFIDKLEADDRTGKHYVVELFFQQLPVVVESSYRIGRCVKAISTCVREGDEVVRDIVARSAFLLPEYWQKEFARELQDQADENEPPATYPTDEMDPFLSSDEPIDEDEIPF